MTANKWGWSSTILSNSTKVQIARAACRQIAYDFGYKCELATSQLHKWNRQLESSIKNGREEEDCDEYTNPLARSKCRSVKYVDFI